MAASALLLSITTFFLVFSFLNLPNALDASTGFSVDLIHRDSPMSPFYNPSESLIDRVSRAIRRSHSRVNHFISSNSVSTATRTYTSSTVMPDSNKGIYLMSISLGTPPSEILAILDTGSNPIWTQCLPCENCYKQVAPLFDPSKSSSYRDLSCNSSMCSNVRNLGCPSRNGPCNYEIFYLDRSYTTGVLATETLAMKSFGSGSVSFPNITFGCGHDNRGFDNLTAGVVGLGSGDLSLVSQLGPSSGNKFAYCLVPYEQNTSSRLDFGDRAVVSGNGTVYTPLMSPHDSYFTITLEMIGVGGTNISLVDLGRVNFIIDSGTTLTVLPTSAYKSLLSVLEGAIHLQPVPDPTNIGLELCYEFGKDFKKVPEMTFRFDGAEVVLGWLNNLIQVNESVSCFAFAGSNSIAIIGNIAQQNFKIGYDLNSMKLALKPADCAHEYLVGIGL